MQRTINGFLLDGTLIGTVANFYRPNKPLTRIDGRPLVNGDVWKKVGQDLAEWDGTQWVGALQQYLIFVLGSASSTASSANSFYTLGNKILLKKFEVTGRVDAVPVNPATDFWVFTLALLAGGGPSALPSPVSVNNQGVNYGVFNNLALSATTNQVIDLSLVINNSSTNPRGFTGEWTKNGAAPNCSALSFSIQYRIIYE